MVAASSIAFGARIAQEKLGLPTATVHLQPTVIRSLVDQGMFGKDAHLVLTADVVQARLVSLDRLGGDRPVLQRPLNDFRSTLACRPSRGCFSDGSTRRSA